MALSRALRSKGRTVALVLLLFAFPEAGAQAIQRDAGIRGEVLGPRGELVADVELSVEGTDISARTDIAGEFQLAGFSAGPYVLLVSKPGFLTQRFRFLIPAAQQTLVEVGSIILESDELKTSTLRGTVTDAKTGKPVEAAFVSIDGTNVTMTNVNGGFRLPTVSRELHYMEIRRVGFGPTYFEIDMTNAGPDVALDIELASVPVSLPTVVVEGARTHYGVGRLRGFYERRGMGLGRFMTREEIEKRNPRVFTDLMFGVRGLRGVRVGASRNQVQLVRASPSCSRQVVYYLNGMRLAGSDVDHFIVPEDVAAIEFYTSPAEVPPEFNSGPAACGVIVIWTR